MSFDTAKCFLTLPPHLACRALSVFPPLGLAPTPISIRTTDTSSLRRSPSWDLVGFQKQRTEIRHDPRSCGHLTSPVSRRTPGRAAGRIV